MPDLVQHHKMVNGYDLHYVASGNPKLPLLLFIHGTPRNQSFFNRYLSDPGLNSKFYLVAIQRPGSAKTDQGKVMRVQQQAQLIAGLLDQLYMAQPIYLVGHSYGGPVAVATAFLHPKIVSGLVILAGTLDPASEKPGKWRKIFINTPLKYLLPGVLRRANEEIWNLKEDLDQLLPGYKKIKSPVWVIHGKKDRLVTWHNAEWVKTKLINSPSINIMLLKNAGHFFPWTHFKLTRQFFLDNLTPDIS
jgi:pimeloyl-ACP methyl ester carboxylesterase